MCKHFWCINEPTAGNAECVYCLQVISIDELKKTKEIT
jgi:hypothetical protein